MNNIQLNDLYNVPGSKKKRKCLGRGIGSGKGKTSGRGVKGQKSRAGVAIKGFEGGQMPMIARLPKRGFRSRAKNDTVHINFVDIMRLVENKHLKAGDTVDRELLLKYGVVKKAGMKVKLLAHGQLSVKLEFALDAYSAAAKEGIVEAGGRVN